MREITDLCLRFFSVIDLSSTPSKLPHKNPNFLRDITAQEPCMREITDLCLRFFSVIDL